MEMMKNAVNWVEIPVTNFDRAKKFYSTIYDYEMPETMMDNYRMGFLLFDQENGGVGGAIVLGDGYEPSNKGVRVYLNGGADLSLILNRVQGAGGKVILDKVQITPELGYYGIFEDPDGTKISLHSMG
jgi:predicted enzyme related to lactoylglutathione lyase